MFKFLNRSGLYKITMVTDSYCVFEAEGFKNLNSNTGCGCA
ncbi:hypothetical protein D3OALGB2SA_1026 [Olavius algarvensis associated proteobacterium Delta 3]|nr:hypothetical protein D3OALGB2SA_1026 [Olavius algarvensis associated proteobacterium Delta 3]